MGIKNSDKVKQTVGLSITTLLWKFSLLTNFQAPCISIELFKVYMAFYWHHICPNILENNIKTMFNYVYTVQSKGNNRFWILLSFLNLKIRTKSRMNDKETGV